MKRVFVTGTDTGVGKTHVTQALLHAARRQGLCAVGFKPVAAGAEQTAAGWRNEDGLALQAASALALDYELINPVVLEAPLSPHLAAQRQGRHVSVRELLDAVARLPQPRIDLCLMEGAGGWRVPLNDEELLSDVARAWAEGVVLVVGMRLGCLNHALLTAQAIRADGLPLLGWVANHIDPAMACLDDNIRYLESCLGAPLLGRVDYGQAPEAARLDCTLLGR